MPLSLHCKRMILHYRNMYNLTHRNASLHYSLLQRANILNVSYLVARLSIEINLNMYSN